jgi:hypothetical protein
MPLGEDLHDDLAGPPDAASRSEAALLPSLADEFFRLGVRNYVGAAWEVNDIGAELFATRLYDPCCPTQARRPQAQRSETPSLRRARRSPRRRRGSDHSGPPTSTTATRRAKHDSSKSASSAFSDDAVDVGGEGGAVARVRNRSSGLDRSVDLRPRARGAEADIVEPHDRYIRSALRRSQRLDREARIRILRVVGRQPGARHPELATRRAGGPLPHTSGQHPFWQEGRFDGRQRRRDSGRSRPAAARHS